MSSIFKTQAARRRTRAGCVASVYDKRYSAPNQHTLLCKPTVVVKHRALFGGERQDEGVGVVRTAPESPFEFIFGLHRDPATPDRVAESGQLASDVFVVWQAPSCLLYTSDA